MSLDTTETEKNAIEHRNEMEEEAEAHAEAGAEKREFCAPTSGQDSDDDSEGILLSLGRETVFVRPVSDGFDGAASGTGCLAMYMVVDSE